MGKQHVRVELYHDFVESTLHKRAWVARAPYTRDPVQITRDRGDQQAEPTTGSASLTFPGHDLNPNNAASPLYGKVRQNTPLRILAGPAAPLTDAFSRSVTDGWGNLDTGQAWVLAGGTVPGDYDVDGFNGTITFTDTNVLRSATVDTGSRDHLVRAIFDLSASDVTGAGTSFTIRGRATDASNYYGLNVAYGVDEVMTISIVKRVAGVATTISDTAQVAFSGAGSGQLDYVGELYVEGNRIYGRVWYRYVDEPIAWIVSTQDDSLTTGTRAGVGGIRATGNTNANLQMRVHDFTAVPGTIRFAGECSSFKPRRSVGPVEYDVDGVPVKGDRWVEVTANGVLRRLGQGEPPAYSALWVENASNNPIAFWPMNDGSTATVAASALDGGQTLTIEGDAGYGPRQINTWVEPILTPDTGTFMFLEGFVNQPTTDTEWSGDFVFCLDADAALADVSFSWEGYGAGSPGSPRNEWHLSLFDDSPGVLGYQLTCQTFHGTSITGHTILADGTIALIDGRLHHVRVTTSNTGANTGWGLLFDGSTVASGTTTGPWDVVSDVLIDYGASTGQVSVGMAVVWDTAGPPFNAANAAVVGRAGELAADRLLRLCLENGVPFELLGDVADTVPMGPQPLAPFGDHVAEIEKTDTGRVYESRHQPGLTMRTRPTLYSQAERLVLDVDDEGVAPELLPDVDGQGVINDVTVVRPDGSSARAVDDDGPVGVNTIGRYPKRFDINVDVDESLPSQASWRRNLFTQAATRYPQVTADLVAVPSMVEAAARLDSGDVLGLDSVEPDRAREMVFGYTETIGSHTRTIAFNTGPSGGYDVIAFGVSRLDTGGSDLASAVDADDATWSVDVTGDALWTTDPSEAPFDVVVGGERVTVTTVTGSSSPQTFTVTRSVNGVAKPHEAGEPVALAESHVLAL
jgi:hypothetical protein